MLSIGQIDIELAIILLPNPIRRSELRPVVADPGLHLLHVFIICYYFLLLFPLLYHLYIICLIIHAIFKLLFSVKQTTEFTSFLFAALVSQDVSSTIRHLPEKLSCIFYGLKMSKTINSLIINLN